MSESIEGSGTKIVCQIVKNPEDVPIVAELFQLAGIMTEQEIDVRLFRDPGKAGASVFSEEFNLYLNRQPYEITDELRDDAIKFGLNSQTIAALGNAIESIAKTTPYTEAGIALMSTALGATAIVVNVEDPAAFRSELDIFVELAKPQQV